jgi:hypothetical protein
MFQPEKRGFGTAERERSRKSIERKSKAKVVLPKPVPSLSEPIVPVKTGCRRGREAGRIPPVSSSDSGIC